MSADPILLFDRLSPPDGWSDYTDVTTEPVAADILAGVFADEGTVVSLDAGRRRRRGIGAAVVVAAFVAGGAVAALLTRSPTETRRITCVSEVSDDPAIRVGLDWDGVTDPVTLCAAEWARGTFGETEQPTDLSACVADNGATVVVPGPAGGCGALGFADFTPPEDEVLSAVDAAGRELNLVLTPSNCVPLADATEEIERVLAKYELRGWAIKIVAAFSDDEPCATAALDAGTATVIIAAAPRPD